jgi:hypothetical protein
MPEKQFPSPSQLPWGKSVPSLQNAAPQGVPAASGTQAPGTPAAPWQAKHSSHGGVQLHEPQSTACMQLLVTLPHLPAQVVVMASGVHFGFRF